MVVCNTGNFVGVFAAKQQSNRRSVHSHPWPEDARFGATSAFPTSWVMMAAFGLL